jgi:hypothetical protein
MQSFSRIESSQIISMLQSASTKELAADILANSDKLIHRSCAKLLAHIYTRECFLGDSTLWANIRAKHWCPLWREDKFVDVTRFREDMNNLIAKKGTKPPKKDKSVLCKVQGQYKLGRYCIECGSWLVEGNSLAQCT